MSDQFQLVAASEIGDEAIRGYLREHWPRGLAIFEKEFYRWQFVEPPAAGGIDRSLAVVNSARQTIVGYMGVTPRSLILADGRSLSGAELTTWFFSPEARGGGLAWQLIGRLQREYDFLLAMNVSAAALAVYRSVDFRFVASMERWIRVFRWEPFLQFVNATNEHRTLPRVRPMTSTAGFAPIAKESMAAALAGWEPTLHRVARDQATAAWRYVNHPVYEHCSFRVGGVGADHEAIVVLRIEDHEAFRIGHVLDVMPMRGDAAKAVEFLEQFGREQKIDLLDVYGLTPTIAARFWKAGWHSVNADRIRGIPHLFNPIELRDPPTMNFAFWSRSAMNELCDLSKFYLSKSDCDGDRPTEWYLENIARKKQPTE